jgi:MFS family permease
MLSIQIVANALGIILAYCVGLALVNRDDGWRAMFGFVALPAMIYGLALLPLMESPRWLIAAGQLNAARRSLRRLFGGDADRELAKIVDERADVDPDATKAEAGRERLWMPTHRPAVSVGLVLVFLSVFAGEDMVLFYAPTVLEQIGFTDTAVSFAATLGLGVISFIATLIAFTVIDQAGRKPMLISGLFVLAASLFVMAVLTQAPQTMSFARWGQVACLAVFVAAFGVTLGPICGIVISEIYPQSIRGRATSLTSSMQSVFAIVFTLTFPILLHAIGLTVTLVGYSVIGVAGALYLMRALPETKAKTLEEITDFWSRRTTAPHTAEV